jgi:tetratricopeptide (TPR) repeat protein
MLAKGSSKLRTREGWLGVPPRGNASLGRLVIVLVAVSTLSGCVWTRGWIAKRSSECQKLCEDSRAARAEGRWQDADLLLDAALRRRPNDEVARLHLAEELWSSGRQLAAADVLTRLAQQYPNDALVALRLAEMELEIGRTQAAWEAVEQAFRSDPINIDVLRCKARLEDRQGDAAAALASYHRLLQAAPDDLDAQLALAELHLRRSQADRAAPILRSVVEHPFVTPQQRSQAQRLLVESYAANQRWSDAAACLAAELQQQPESTADDWYRLASLQVQCGQPAAALTSAQQTLLQQPDHRGAKELIQQLQPTDADVLPAGFERRADAVTGWERL